MFTQVSFPARGRLSLRWAKQAHIVYPRGIWTGDGPVACAFLSRLLLSCAHQSADGQFLLIK
jgi:hypothetical protein